MPLQTCQDYPHEVALSPMETVGAEIFELLKEAISGIFAVVSKITLFTIWALLALIILPCVFVAGHIFPLWQEWGEEF